MIMNSVSNTLEAFNHYDYIPEVTDDTGDSFYLYHLTQCGKHVRENLAVVDVYIAPAMATRITRSRRVTFAEQLANFGMVSKARVLNSLENY